MRYLFTIALLLMVAGCSGPAFEEAYHLDREFGDAQRAAFDKQIAYPDSPYAGKGVEGNDGIRAEGIMKTHQETYYEPPAPNTVLELGVAEDSVR